MKFTLSKVKNNILFLKFNAYVSFNYIINYYLNYFKMIILKVKKIII